jgi:hypothetical protein
MRLCQQHNRTPQCGSANLIPWVIAGLLTTIWYWHQQTQVTEVHVQELGSSIPPNMLLKKEEATGLARLSPEENLHALRAGSVALAFDQVFTATQVVAPVEPEPEEEDTAPLIQPAIVRAAVAPSLTTPPLHLPSAPQETSQPLQHSKPIQRIGTATMAHVENAPIMLPVFQLDSFLIPASDRRIYYDPKRVEALFHEATAVFVIKAGTKLTLDGCNFPGGVIVKVTELENAEDWKITRVELVGGTKIGGGIHGVAINLGLVAPDCDLEYSYAGGEFAAQIDIEGFTAVNKLRRTHQIQLQGVVLVKDQERQVWESAIEADPQVSENLPPGMVYLLPDTAWNFLTVD